VELYDRIAMVGSHLGILGEKLRGSVQAYNATLGSFTSRLEVTARRFSEVGARSDREIEPVEPLDVQPRLVAAGDDGAA
jgi:DNA recombination protein RmuC